MDVRGVTIPIADPPINCGPPSFVETQAAVNRLKWGKAPGICGIHAELLNAGGNAVLMSLHAALCIITGTHASSQMTGRGALLSFSGKGRVIAKAATTTEADAALSAGKVFARIILDRVPHHLLEHQHPEQSGFTQKGQRLTVSLPFGSSPNADERIGRGCLQPMLISAKPFIQ